MSLDVTPLDAAHHLVMSRDALGVSCGADGQSIHRDEASTEGPTTFAIRVRDVAATFQYAIVYGNK